MSAGTNRCPKCNGDMVQGFTCGREGPNRVVSTWVEGTPEKVGSLKKLSDEFERFLTQQAISRCSEAAALRPWDRSQHASSPRRRYWFDSSRAHQRRIARW